MLYISYHIDLMDSNFKTRPKLKSVFSLNIRFRYYKAACDFEVFRDNLMPCNQSRTFKRSLFKSSCSVERHFNEC